MKRLPSTFSLLALWAGLALPGLGAVPPPEQLLPADTLAMFCTPDWSKVQAAQKAAPFSRLWNDDAMRPFREKLVNKLTKDVLEPLEHELGVKLADYCDLAQGQFAVAVTQNGWTGAKQPVPGVLLVLDARDKADQLKKSLAEIRQKLAESGKKLKQEKLRDVEFTTLSLDLAELGRGVQKGLAGGEKGGADQKKDPADPADKDAAPFALSFGQAGSLLLVGTSPKDLEKVLARVAGAGAGCLGEQPAFEANYRALFREALSYGWVHAAPLLEVLTKRFAEEGNKQAGQIPMAPNVEKILGALGVGSLKTLAMAVKQGADGATVDLFVGAPEDKRKGLFKMLNMEAKEAGPPAFVPADAIQFSRWRGDGQKLWATLESTVNEISPGILAMVLSAFETSLKEKNPDFDFRKNIIANLGDDVISYQKAPRGKTWEDYNAAPSLFLVGSPNAEACAVGLKALLGTLPAPLTVTDFKEREFLGRKVHTGTLPSLPTAGGSGKERNLHLAASGGYVAVSTDAATIEEYLRSGDAKPKPLAETPGFAEAAQRIGGTATGFFGFQNDVESMRALFELLKSSSDFLSKTFAATPLAQKFAGTDKDKALAEWVDFSLLPPFEKLAKFFYLTVYSGRMSAEGFAMKFVTPTPPQLRP